jgi:hypothetical protein
VERSITQAEGGDGTPTLKAGDPANDEESTEESTEGAIGWLRQVGESRTLWGSLLVLVCLAAYYLIVPDRGNTYLHFVLQAQSWLEGRTAIPSPGYQDVMPVYDASGMPTGYGIIPFPPLPAWVLLPFVSVWHLATDEHLLAMVFAAVDVGIAYWMLGFLPVRHSIRVLTTLFLGLGTVLWYAAAIGSTWFWAHIVAIGCGLLAIGLALSADRDAAEPEPLGDVATSIRRFRLPGGWSSAALLCALGAGGGLVLMQAGAGAPATTLALLGVVVGVVAVALAMAVAGRTGVLGPFAIAVVIVAGLPALLLISAESTLAIEVADALLLTLIGVLWWLGGRQGSRVDKALSSIGTALASPESRQVGAGLLFGLAVTARLTVLFGFPFFILVGGGGNWARRGLLAGAGAALPLVALLVYTYAATGQLFNPAYQYQYGVELKDYGALLNYNPGWSITDIRYIPQNLAIMFAGMPRIMPNFSSIWPGDGGTALCVSSSARGLFDQGCPLAIPEATGTSILLTSPAYLLAPLAWGPIRRLRIDRLTAGATIAVVAIAIVNLMHFSQGWVQFGYRFSSDFAPFALLLVALGASRLGRWWPLVLLLPAVLFLPLGFLAAAILVVAILIALGSDREPGQALSFGRLWPVVLLVALSIAVNFWGTMWGVILGW